MDRLISFLDNKKLEPKSLLPIVTLWISEKGSATQLIEWIHGLQREKEAIFRSLDACSIGETEEMEADAGQHDGEAGLVSIEIQAEADGPSKKAQG